MAKRDTTLERLKREALVEDGAYDGRFVTKVVESDKRKEKKKRKKKIKPHNIDDDADNA